MTKLLAIAALAIGCLAAHGAGVEAEHVVSALHHHRVEVGRWTQDEAGRSRFDIDEWTQIMDPVEGVTYRANSRRGWYSRSGRATRVPPMGTPLIDAPGSLNAERTQEISRTDLGTRELEGVACKGTLVEVVVTGPLSEQHMEFEAWRTDAFAFPLNMVFKVRHRGTEETIELRNVVELTDAELGGRFAPAEHWKRSLLPLSRANVSWTGFGPFAKGGSKVTGKVLPLPLPW